MRERGTAMKERGGEEREVCVCVCECEREGEEEGK